MKSFVPDEVEFDWKAHDEDPDQLPLWFEQLAKLDESKRTKIKNEALKRIKESKPRAYEFIQKYRCELVGFMPRNEYMMEKDDMNEIDIVWRHPYSIPTLLYWCKHFGFGFFVNANLMYNESVLDAVPGNKKQKLRGWTG